MTPVTRPLRRKEASLYLKEKYGIDRATSTLAKLAVIGGGPKFLKANNVPLYPPDFLDEWAHSILTPPLRSTSDLAIRQLRANNEPSGLGEKVESGDKASSRS